MVNWWFYPYDYGTSLFLRKFLSHVIYCSLLATTPFFYIVPNQIFLPIYVECRSPLCYRFRIHFVPPPIQRFTLLCLQPIAGR